MTPAIPEHHPLHRLFSGTIQHVFYSDIGMCDPQIAEYLADLLSQFIHYDQLYPFHDAEGRRIENLAEMISDAELEGVLSAQERRRTIHRHIGDFSLFWTGVFPEGLRRMPPVGLGDPMNDYLAQGKRSYAIASDLTPPDECPPARMLQRLSENFEHCVFGLHLCRKEWEELGQGFPPSVS